MSVSCECCVLSGRGLCVGLIICTKESYRLWCVVVCDLETPKNEAMASVGPQRQYIYIYIYIYIYLADPSSRAV